jgi:hypothetical protein
MGFDLGSLLSQCLGTATPANAPDHFEQVAQAAPQDLLSRGLAAMFHSDQTPPFAQMAAQLFDRANPDQQAGMLNRLLGSMGPSALASLGGLLGSLAPGGAVPAAITPEQASTVSPEQVREIASHAEQHAPGIVEEMSGFYAEHAGLIKTLGGAALTIAMSKMAENHRS